MTRAPHADRLSRRGQGMSINVIILVALGLVILILAIILVSRSFQKAGTSATNDCIARGGLCKIPAASDPKCGTGFRQEEGVSCGTGSTDICCVVSFG